VIFTRVYRLEKSDLIEIAAEGKVSLEELDHFRYVDAPSRFSKKVVGRKSIHLVDLQKLVHWKLYVLTLSSIARIHCLCNSKADIASLSAYRRLTLISE